MSISLMLKTVNSRRESLTSFESVVEADTDKYGDGQFERRLENNEI